MVLREDRELLTNSMAFFAKTAKESKSMYEVHVFGLELNA